MTSQPHSSDTESDSESASEVNDKQPSKRECTDSSAQPKMKKRKVNQNDLHVYLSWLFTPGPYTDIAEGVESLDVN